MTTQEDRLEQFMHEYRAARERLAAARARWREAEDSK
jgi:hypothetical protein